MSPPAEAGPLHEDLSHLERVLPSGSGRRLDCTTTTTNNNNNNSNDIDNTDTDTHDDDDDDHDNSNNTCPKLMILRVVEDF